MQESSDFRFLLELQKRTALSGPLLPELAVLPSKIQQRAEALFCCAEFDGIDLSQEDLMISAGINRMGPAFDPHKRSPDQRHAGLTSEVQVLRTLAILFREERRQVGLTFGKHADAEAPGVLERL